MNISMIASKFEIDNHSWEDVTNNNNAQDA